MARQPNASYEGAGQRQTLGVQEALKKIAELQTQLAGIQEEINEITKALNGKANTNAPTIVNPTLQFLLADETVEAEFRRSGSSGQYGLSIVFTDEDGTNHFYNMVNHLGERQFPPLSHASADNTYGVGTGLSFGHCKTISNLNRDSYVDGEALAAYQGYVLDRKIGNIQILSVTYVNADSPTYVDAGGQWTDATVTIPAFSGATGYYFIPISSNYGAVSQITMNGREVTCIVRNVSGERHTCRVRALAVAYKTV